MGGAAERHPVTFSMIQPWPTVSSTPKGDFRIFTIRSDIKQSPRTGEEHDFVVIECVNWVNVIAITSDDKLVMVEQFRHGSNTVELEIPGGVMDPEDVSPEHAALRELREETGYQGDSITMIGEVFSNPAIMNNTCFTVLVRNCSLNHKTDFDHTEDLITRLVPISEVPDLVGAGRIRHSLVVVALFHFELWRRKLEKQA